MFEKFLIDDLYYCSISDIVPIGMTNLGGFISIDSFGDRTYNTTVVLRNGKYYDINNLNRIINVVRAPQRDFPITSKDNHLYIIDEETLVPVRAEVSSEYNVLQRLPFGKKRYIK
jgi:hypothetical protein